MDGKQNKIDYKYHQENYRHDKHGYFVGFPRLHHINTYRQKTDKGYKESDKRANKQLRPGGRNGKVRNNGIAAEKARGAVLSSLFKVNTVLSHEEQQQSNANYYDSNNDGCGHE